MTSGLLAAACALDLAIGDPHVLPHPVRALGAAISAADRARPQGDERGRDLALGAALTAALVTAAFLAGFAADRAPAGIRVTAAASMLAARSLDDAVRDVAEALEARDVATARRAVGRIVGRDTQDLDEADIARAALETLAESFCDGVVAPLLALRIGGCAAAFAFKAISTLDSMIGHPEAPYTWFGCVAARTDDAANFIPARVAALAIASAAFALRANGGEAVRVPLADAALHRSPNAGWPEAALAGALGVRLGGDNRYDGVLVEAAAFNAFARRPNAHDIRRGLTIVRIAFAICASLACIGPVRVKR